MYSNAVASAAFMYIATARFLQLSFMYGKDASSVVIACFVAFIDVQQNDASSAAFIDRQLLVLLLQPSFVMYSNTVLLLLQSLFLR